MIYKKFLLQLSVESVFLIPIQLNSPWNWRPTVIEFVGTMRKVLVALIITAIWFALDDTANIYSGIYTYNEEV